jgi:hypothetical protein
MALSRPCSLLWVVTVMLAGCESPEHELLATGTSGGSNSLSTPGGNQGTGGTGGCSSGNCDQRRPCESDRDCEQNPLSVCVGDQCVGCEALPPTAPSCLPGWVADPDSRNGCLTWRCRIPATARCTSDLDCMPGERCYPGMDCSGSGSPGAPAPPPPGPGGSPDPAMCRGNLCGLAGCPDTGRLDCMVVGCANGFTCQSSCTSPLCGCDPMMFQWVCGAGCGASVCVPPS